jgi:hypothetical protein
LETAVLHALTALPRPDQRLALADAPMTAVQRRV